MSTSDAVDRGVDLRDREGLHLRPDPVPSREVELSLPGGFRINPGIRAAVKSLPGIVDVHDI